MSISTRSSVLRWLVQRQRQAGHNGRRLQSRRVSFGPRDGDDADEGPLRGPKPGVLRFLRPHLIPAFGR
ncbi:unnamed protein product [Sphagnum troendelagicum]|uniref:Uncharacterized protein n=1 Tax=Sphagnum troendelagicum TaxID=128251 RepID=A0ABP0UWT5_9BRYO